MALVMPCSKPGASEAILSHLRVIPHAARVPVREALRELEARELIKSGKHAGMLVCQLSARETAGS